MSREGLYRLVGVSVVEGPEVDESVLGSTDDEPGGGGEEGGTDVGFGGVLVGAEAVEGTGELWSYGRGEVREEGRRRDGRAERRTIRRSKRLFELSFDETSRCWPLWSMSTEEISPSEEAIEWTRTPDETSQILMFRSVEPETRMGEEEGGPKTVEVTGAVWPVLKRTCGVNVSYRTGRK